MLSARRRPAWLAAIAVAAVALWALTPTGGDGQPGRAADLLGLALVLGGVVALAALPRRPWLGLAASAACGAALLVADAATTSVQLTVAVALLGVGRNAGARSAWGLCAVLVVGGLAGGLLVDDQGLAQAATLGAVLALPVLAGRLLVADAERRRLQADEAARAQRTRELAARAAWDAERVRIAREVHDVVGHHLSAIAIQAHAAQVDDHHARTSALATIADLAARGIDETRRVVVGDPVPVDFDALLAEARRDGLELHVERDPAAATMHPAGEILLAQALREALTNVRRHGRPRADVRLQVSARDVRLDVRSPLTGTPAATASRGGFGIAALRTRFEREGGHVHAGPEPGGSWVLSAALPREAA